MITSTFSAATYSERRAKLKKSIESGTLLFLGNGYSPMNYKDNYYHFRQDSCFLYYFGLNVDGLNAIIDIDNDKEIIFGDELTMADIVWTGPLPSISDLAAQVGISQTEPSSRLSRYVSSETHYLPPYRGEHKIFLSKLLDIPIQQIQERASSSMVQSIISQRNIKSEEEIAELDRASSITSKMHHYVMSSVKPGIHEYDLVAKAYEVIMGHDTQFSFPCILTKNGQTLHNHDHSNLISDGDLVLFDGGACSALSYAGDMTRTFPANGKYSQKQKDIYNIVLQAETECIEFSKPGIKYVDAHLHAAKVIANGLKDLGLMQGDVNEAVAQGAHALFFQHGLGHMIGLDVHDMENLGEQNVGYESDQSRSPQFGTAYLRLARTLEAGNAITVEPGIYFIPALIDQWKTEQKICFFH